MAKYTLTEPKKFGDITLYRIRRESDGELGGWIEKESNLSQVAGDAWVSGNARVYVDPCVAGDPCVARVKIWRKFASIGRELRSIEEWRLVDYHPEISVENLAMMRQVLTPLFELFDK